MPTRTPGGGNGGFGGNGGLGSGSFASGGGLGNTNAGARPFVGSPGQAGGGLGTGSSPSLSGGPSMGSSASMGSSLGGGTDSWPMARNPGDLAADPVHGDETSAGLPMRVPKANLIPGSAAGAQPGAGAGAGAGTGRAAARSGSTQESQTLSAPLPQRSPEMARSRLSGFQRGARRAEGQTPRAGEGTDR